MLIGMVMDENKKNIVPFINGKYVRVYDDKSEKYKDVKNPSLQLNTGKRSAVISWFYNQNIELICSPPNTFCELSYKSAKEKKMNFLTFEENIPFETFKKRLKNGDINLTSYIEKRNLKSN